jgi:hypothetical protein
MASAENPSAEKLPTPIGTRVVAGSHYEGKTLFVIGRGVFEGYFLPPEIEADLPNLVAEIREQYAVQRSITPDLPETFTDQDAKTALLLTQTSPRIKLDDVVVDGKTIPGETIWGYECWWHDIGTFEEKSKGYTLAGISVEQARERNKKLAMEEERFATMLEASAK